MAEENRDGDRDHNGLCGAQENTVASTARIHRALVT
jgi:hypothetical protein